MTNGRREEFVAALRARQSNAEAQWERALGSTGLCASLMLAVGWYGADTYLANSAIAQVAASAIALLLVVAVAYVLLLLPRDATVTVADLAKAQLGLNDDLAQELASHCFREREGGEPLTPVPQLLAALDAQEARDAESAVRRAAAATAG